MQQQTHHVVLEAPTNVVDRWWISTRPSPSRSASLGWAGSDGKRGKLVSVKVTPYLEILDGKSTTLLLRGKAVGVFNNLWRCETELLDIMAQAVEIMPKKSDEDAGTATSRRSDDVRPVSLSRSGGTPWPINDLPSRVSVPRRDLLPLLQNFYAS